MFRGPTTTKNLVKFVLCTLWALRLRATLILYFRQKKVCYGQDPPKKSSNHPLRHLYCFNSEKKRVKIGYVRAVCTLAMYTYQVYIPGIQVYRYIYQVYRYTDIHTRYTQKTKPKSQMTRTFALRPTHTFKV